MQTAASASGIPRLPPRAGRERAVGPRGASRPRQLRHAQTPDRARVARPPSPLSPPLHAYVRVVAQSSGALVCPHYAARDSPRLVPQSARINRPHRPLREIVQRDRPALPVDRDRRQHSRQAPTTYPTNLRDITLAMADLLRDIALFCLPAPVVGIAAVALTRRLTWRRALLGALLAQWVIILGVAARAQIGFRACAGHDEPCLQSLAAPVSAQELTHFRLELLLVLGV